MSHLSNPHERIRELSSSAIVNNNINTYDLIVPKKFYWGKKSVKEIYILGHGFEKDLNQTRKSIEKISPVYLNSYDKILDSHSAFYCNMFITKKNYFEKYTKWLFSILEDVENSIDISNYSTQETRVFGYISEILLNVWVDKNNLKYKELNLVNTEESMAKALKTKIYYLYKRIN